MIKYRCISWNINGFRAILNKDFWKIVTGFDVDILGLQEVKAEISQIPENEQNPQNLFFMWNSSRKRKGYSGTASYSRQAPISFKIGMDNVQFGGEGRVITLEYEHFYFCNVYFPNGQKDDERLAFKMGFYDVFLEYCEKLRKHKPIVACGDFNTAHKEIDLKNPKANSKSSGFLPIERAWLDKFISAGYIDTFRLFFPNLAEQYSWWSYRFSARTKNAGWRIDYFFVSEELLPFVKEAFILQDVMGSDHCPVGILLDI